MWPQMVYKTAIQRSRLCISVDQQPKAWNKFTLQSRYNIDNMNQLSQVLVQHLPQAELSSVVNATKAWTRWEKKCKIWCKMYNKDYLTVFRLNDQRLLNLIERAQNWRIFFVTYMFLLSTPEYDFHNLYNTSFCCFFLLHTFQNHFIINLPWFLHP